MDAGKKAVRKLGGRVKELREAKGWTQQHLAASLGVEQSYISGIERGTYPPSFPKLVRLAVIFELSISDLCKDI